MSASFSAKHSGGVDDPSALQQIMMSSCNCWLELYSLFLWWVSGVAVVQYWVHCTCLSSLSGCHPLCSMVPPVCCLLLVLFPCTPMHFLWKHLTTTLWNRVIGLFWLGLHYRRKLLLHGYNAILCDLNRREFQAARRQSAVLNKYFFLNFILLCCGLFLWTVWAVCWFTSLFSCEAAMSWRWPWPTEGFKVWFYEY